MMYSFYLLQQGNIIVKKIIVINLTDEYVKKNLELVNDDNEIYKNYFDKLGNRLLRSFPSSELLNSFI